MALSWLDQELWKRRADTLLCHNCGWNMKLQVRTGYASTVKCFFGQATRGMWYIGSEYVLKELPLIDSFGDDYIGTDFATTKWVRENTKIPVVEEMKYWKDDNSHFFLMKRVPGESLEDAWPRLSGAEKANYAREVIEYIAELRKHKAPSPQTVEGAPVRDQILGSTHTSVVVIEDKETWWARVAKGIRRTDSAWLEEYKSRYPKQPTQYVLTHCDLNIGNIMVHDGHVSGIIDWEHAGYLPDWWEHACACNWIQEPLWQSLICKEMEKQLETEFGNHRDAARFCGTFSSIHTKPPRDTERRKFEDRGNFCDCKPDF
jgi:aminoglycoside phosphotransferase